MTSDPPTPSPPRLSHRKRTPTSHANETIKSCIVEISGKSVTLEDFYQLFYMVEF